MLLFPPKLSFSGTYLFCVSLHLDVSFFIVSDSKLLLQEGFGRHHSNRVTNLLCSCYHYKTSYSLSMHAHYYKNAYLPGKRSDFCTAASTKTLYEYCSHLFLFLFSHDKPSHYVHTFFCSTQIYDFNELQGQTIDPILYFCPAVVWIHTGSRNNTQLLAV